MKVESDSLPVQNILGNVRSYPMRSVNLKSVKNRIGRVPKRASALGGPSTSESRKSGWEGQGGRAWRCNCFTQKLASDATFP